MLVIQLYMAQNDNFFKLDQKPTVKFEFRAWFEVIQTFGSRDTTIFIPDEPNASQPPQGIES